MKNYLPHIILIIVFLAVDVYAFKSLRLVTSGWVSPVWRTVFQILYWVSTIGAYALVIYAFATYRNAMHYRIYFFVYMAFGTLMLLFVPKLIISLFHLMDDLVQLFRVGTQWFVHKSSSDSFAETSRTITRWQFISKTGWVLAALPFAGMIYGFVQGRFRFRVERETLYFPHLPPSFEGLKIVQLSDIHIGSFFGNHRAVSEGIDLVNSLKPDLILFTGDMVNNYAEELDGWEEVLSRLKAGMGKYSVLGNHDYGDYSNWPDEESKEKNLQGVITHQENVGFRVLINEWVTIRSAEGEELELIGTENWGTGGFSKYGDLKKAMLGTDPEKVQILMSHDPTHWDEQVLGDTAIDLTLAGHTHGMQVGIEIPGIIKWSPSKYRYKRWAGLYREGKQFLYVNRGFGYIGFPARIGIWPEVTLLELRRGEKK